ncbi:MAG: hydroxymethylglutaryl-CoA lyase [Candidatus Hydrogenedentes bacterium]|nr:hydroxymethylglutaryl-CoA lyase [Candidatus Hydrogenedentota bacterium]
MERDVVVQEDGLRDGLQNVDVFFPTELKKAWITAEYEAGVREMQVCSFVPEKLMPQFKDALEIVAHARTLPGLTISALVPNLKGAQRAFEAGVHVVGYVLSASESHNQSNVRRSVAESIEDFARIAELRASNEAWRDVRLGGGIATSFGCTIEGHVDPAAVERLAEMYVEHGADEISIADTVGYANPAQVKDLFTRLKAAVGDVPMSAHFHDTRGLGLANVVAALDAGVRDFDACLGGLGGCPFAPGATGNIVTEDTVFMLESMGLRTGIDLDKLIAVREIVESGLPDDPLRSAIAQAKPPVGFVPASALAQQE